MIKAEISTIDEEFEKSRVKAHVRTRRGKLERVKSFSRKGEKRDVTVKDLVRAMPGGSKSNYQYLGPSHERSELPYKVQWYKRGGHAGAAIIQRVVEKFKSLGFKPVEESKDFATPDGSVMGWENTLKDNQGRTLSWSRSYGEVKQDNSFSIILRLSE